MPSYLLELYVPRTCSVPEAFAAARSIEDAARRYGLELRYVRTLLVVEDETCFHVFEAPSREVLDASLDRAGVREARITETIQSDADRS
jgi:hypothetical protein